MSHGFSFTLSAYTFKSLHVYVIDSFSVERGVNVVGVISGATTACERCKMDFSPKKDVPEPALHDTSVLSSLLPSYDQTREHDLHNLFAQKLTFLSLSLALYLVECSRFAYRKYNSKMCRKYAGHAFPNFHFLSLFAWLILDISHCHYC